MGMQAVAVVELKAGRELDALVAERLFKCKVKWFAGVPSCCCRGNRHDSKGECDLGLLHYSTDIAAAWKVWKHIKAPVKRLQESNGRFDMLLGRSSFGADSDIMSVPLPPPHEYGAEAPTPQLAICLAALAERGVAVRLEVE